MSARTSLRVLLLPLVLLAAACTAPIQLPKDFLELRDYPDYQAVTGDDARVWVREFDDEHEASLAFWAQALEHDFTQRGYELLGRGDVKSGRGVKGVWFECAANVRGERVGYLIAIWLADHRVTVVEFAARAEVFAQRVSGMRDALKTVRL